MDHPEHPTEAQILVWLSLYMPTGRNPFQTRRVLASLPRIARVLRLRYWAEPPLSTRAIAAEYGLHDAHISLLGQRGLALLA